MQPVFACQEKKTKTIPTGGCAVKKKEKTSSEPRSLEKQSCLMYLPSECDDVGTPPGRHVTHITGEAAPPAAASSIIHPPVCHVRAALKWPHYVNTRMRAQPSKRGVPHGHRSTATVW